MTTLSSQQPVSPTQQILVAISSDTVFAHFEPLMSRSDLRIMRVRSGQRALTLAHDVVCDLILCQHPLADIGFPELYTQLRAAGCASVESPILMMARADRRDALLEQFDSDDDRLFCVELEQEEDLKAALAEFVGVAVRATSRLMVETHFDCNGENSDRIFQTTNVSESGLLLRSQKPLPVGFRTNFDLSLPESETPIRGVAEVVRHTNPDCELYQGMGVRLLQVEGDGRARLARFIEDHLPKPGE